MKHFILRNPNRFCSLYGYHPEKNLPPVPPKARAPKKKVDYSWLEQYRIRTFIDIGAYHGEYVDFAAEHFPGAKIYAFEPQPEAVKVLEQKAAVIPGMTLYNTALGESDCTTTFFISSFEPCSSVLPLSDILKTTSPESSPLTPITVRMAMLDTVLGSAELEDNIFIKMDSQGYEDCIISGGRKIFSRAAVVQTEVSFEEVYEGQKLFDAIYGQPKELGFSMAGFRNQIFSPMDGYIMQAHAYFVRR